MLRCVLHEPLGLEAQEEQRVSELLNDAFASQAANYTA